MRALALIMLTGTVLASDLPANHGKTRPAKQKTQFALSYYDIRENLIQEVPKEGVIVEFEISETGKVENPRITEEYNINLSETIIDKVLELKFKPALQNGRPVRIRYKLPIIFK
tara:strand:- start:417 stop:758 length:342 start_codon:yes stop_codon:yes gene_type:complete